VHERSLIDLLDVLGNHKVVMDQVANLLEGRFSSDQTERVGVKLVTCLCQDGHQHITTCAALQHLQNVYILVCDIVRFELSCCLSIPECRHLSQFRLIFSAMRVRKPEFFFDLLTQSFVHRNEFGKVCVFKRLIDYCLGLFRHLFLFNLANLFNKMRHFIQIDVLHFDVVYVTSHAGNAGDHVRLLISWDFTG